jgi:hypothetical protein
MMSTASATEAPVPTQPKAARPPKHGTVKLTCPLTRGKVDIDARLAPLIRELWRLEIITFQCCEEAWPGLSQIEFPGTGEVNDFLFISQEDFKAELETWDEGDNGQLSIQIRLLVHFPVAMIPQLVERFAGYQRNKDGEFLKRK